MKLHLFANIILQYFCIHLGIRANEVVIQIAIHQYWQMRPFKFNFVAQLLQQISIILAIDCFLLFKVVDYNKTP